MVRDFLTPQKFLLIALILLVILIVCARALTANSGGFRAAPPEMSGLRATSTAYPGIESLPTARRPADPLQTPTPDSPHPLPSLRSQMEQYVIRAGDTLNQIAQRYGVAPEDIVRANNLPNADVLEVGQQLIIPLPTPQNSGPDFKIIPDSELVYGPLSAPFDVTEFVNGQGGYLASYWGEVGDQTMSGAQIVARVSQQYSVNPRLLLAVLEIQSGWVTQSNPPEVDFPIGVRTSGRKGLYRQLTWAADNLNRGYYLYRVLAPATWTLADGSVAPIAPTINAGTAGVQHFFAQLYGRAEWERMVTNGGLFATFFALFGYPFDYTFEPLLPSDLAQPVFQLPFEPQQSWAYTGGPHGGWGSGSAWAALDFAPPSEALGCVPSDAWIVAVTDGLIVRSGEGAVVQDLDGDGYEQTGWTVLYLHVETRDRIATGTFLHAGEHIGHPSCEGGYSTGTHLHLARRYNGEWIPADQSLPFVLDGWVSAGSGNEYDGYLQKEGRTVVAMEGRFPENAIGR